MSMFPGLPGDPPWPETIGAIAAVALLAGSTTAVLQQFRGQSSRRAWLFLTFAFVVLVGAAATVASRNVGRWGDLKRELSAYAIVVSQYEQEHGVIRSEAAAEEFYKRNPRTFSFDRDREVQLAYFWWHDPARVGITWGRGGAAVFDLNTMLCIYSD
jgi:hypothetical protein